MFRLSKTIIIAIACSVACLCSAQAGLAAETVIVKATLNTVKRGEIFVSVENGAVALRADDLTAWGVDLSHAVPTTTAEGNLYSIASFPGMVGKFDEQHLSLDITVDPALLPSSLIKKSQKTTTLDNSTIASFLNYGYATNITNGGVTNTILNYEWGTTYKDFLLYNSGYGQKDLHKTAYYRLMTQLIHDDRESMIRWTIGDLTATSGQLGSGAIMGGIQIAKNFRINPYFYTKPTFSYSGTVQSPSDVEVWYNGSKIRTQHVEPGRYSLADFPANGVGYGLFDVVVRDAFGRESTISAQNYASDALLKPGLSDFNYSLGFTRPRYGMSNDNYDRPAFFYYHALGINQKLTAGIRGEYTTSLANQGVFLVTTPFNLAQLSTGVSGSYAKGGRAGIAGIMALTVTNGNYTGGLIGRYATPDYQSFVDHKFCDDQLSVNLRSRETAIIYGSYATPAFGTLSGQIMAGRTFGGVEQYIASARYTRNITKDITIAGSISQGKNGGEYTTTGGLMLTYSPSSDHLITANFNATDTGQKTSSIAVQKNVPLNEGYGYALRATQDAGNSIEAYTIQPSVSINTKYFQFKSDAIFNNGTPWHNSVAASLTGSVLMVDGKFALSRTMIDSFAIIETGIPDATVYSANMPVGKTDSNGQALIPSMGSYLDNVISLGDDVPIEYQLTRKTASVIPAYRSGVHVCFPSFKLQSLNAVVVVADADGKMHPVKFGEVSVAYNSRTVITQTGNAGEMYLDSSQFVDNGAANADPCTLAGKPAPAILPGEYEGIIAIDGARYEIIIKVPLGTDPVVELGTLIGKPVQAK